MDPGYNDSYPSPSEPTDAHSKAPRNFPTMQNYTHDENSFSEGMRATDSNAPPTTMMNTPNGMKDTYSMSPNELRKHGVVK